MLGTQHTNLDSTIMLIQKPLCQRKTAKFFSTFMAKSKKSQCTNGGFPEWGYPRMDGLEWKIQLKWRI